MKPALFRILLCAFCSEIQHLLKRSQTTQLNFLKRQDTLFEHSVQMNEIYLSVLDKLFEAQLTCLRVNRSEIDNFGVHLYFKCKFPNSFNIVTVEVFGFSSLVELLARHDKF